MRPSIKSLLTKLDRQIKRWHRDERPYKLGNWKDSFCPVCGSSCEYDTDYMEHIMLEEHISCPNRCYSYDFVTGSTETRVGDVIVHHYYADSEDDRQHQNRIINLSLIHERSRRAANTKPEVTP